MARRPKQARRAPRAIKLAAFDALKVEGALLQPETIARVASLQASEQGGEHYGLDPNEKLRDVVQSKFSLGQALHVRFKGSDQGASATQRFLSGLFLQVFEFSDLVDCGAIAVEGRSFPIARHAGGGRAPIVFAPATKLDEATSAFGDGGRKRSAAQMLQEYLNADDRALWGLVCDGATLRLYRDNAALTRPAYIEADLTRIFDPDAPLMADFAALWLLIHASRFGAAGASASDCPLERWREESRKQGATAREKLREGVEAALLELGAGFMEHPANTKLLQDLREGALSPQAYLQGLLRLIYQFIFVLTAEDRDVLHAPAPEDDDLYPQWRKAKALYAEGYGFSRLRDRAAKRQFRDRHGDAWEGVKNTLKALWRGEKALALPALGGLFARGEVRDFSDCALSNQRFFEAMFRLGWFRTDAGLERVNWRDMETEELGSVYESLLELTPSLFGAQLFAFVTAAGNARKTTASYYTPDSLVQALLNETLDPLIEETVKGKSGDTAVEALLSLKIIDPACGSGHFLLSAARRIAARIAQLMSPGAPSPADFRHWLREAARRCLFGVDRNPMAVELAKVALWIETVEPGKPLTFLDAHIRCGDALLGVYDLAALQKGIPNEAYKALTGDLPAAATAWRARNSAERDARAQGEFSFYEPPRDVLEAARALEAKAEDDLSGVEAKAAAFAALLKGPERWRMEVACDLYVAAFLMPKLAPPGRHAGETTAFIPTSRDVWEKLAGKQPYSLVEANGVDAAKEARAFHWQLEFPQVFFPAAGKRAGFDLAIGNPPWEVNQLGEEEYFSQRAPDIAVLAGQARKDAIAKLKLERPHIWTAYERDKRVFDASNSFFRGAERYPLTATGKVNTYALFSELFATIAERVGVIVPRNIATDATTAPFFGHVVSSQRLRALICFENEAFIFPSVHHAYQFAILVLESARKRAARFRQFIRYFPQLSDGRREYELTAAEIAAINPNTKTAPVFRSRADADLTKQIYARVPVLINDARGAAGNPWGIEFRQGLFNMTSDSGLFRTAAQLSDAGFSRDGRDWVNAAGARYVPLMEAKMIHHYDHRWASYAGTETEDVKPAQKADPDFDVTPRYWVPETEVASRLAAKSWTRGWLMGWRDITNATNERTVIASAFPRAAVGHTSPLFFIRVGIPHWACFISIMSSLILDYVARQKIGGTHLTYGYLNQFPWPAPTTVSEADLAFIVPRVLELSYTSHSMRPFAEDLGFTGPPFAWDEDRRALLRAELDARIARLYGLTRDQLRYILDPEDVMGAGYPSETFRVLKKSEIAKHGDYRTARLVLAAWDREARGEVSTSGPPIDVRRPAAAPAPIRLPDGAWVRAAGADLRNDTLAQFAAILKALPAPMPADQVRLAALFALEPRYLTARLTGEQKSEWLRLVGDEAAAMQNNAIAMIAPRINAYWRDAYTQLRGMAALVEDGVSGTWSAGASLEQFETPGWPDGRAEFVMAIVSTLNVDAAVTELPAEEQNWVRSLAA